MPDQDPALDLLDVARHEAWLRPLVRSLVGDDAAGDVLQHTWLQAWRVQPRAATLRGWLARVATRSAVSHRRAEVRRRRREAQLPVPDPEPSTAATVERLAVQRAVSQAVSELAEPYRTAVLLRWYHGLSIDQIAQRTGTTPGNVRQRTSRGLAWMRVRLESDIGRDWRRSPAVLGLAGVDIIARAAAGPGSAFLLLLMTNLRLAILAVAALALLGALWTFQIAPPDPAVVGTGEASVEVAPHPGDGQPASAPVEGDAPNAQRSEMPPAVAAPRVDASVPGEVLDVHGRPVPHVEIEVIALRTGERSELVHADAAGRFTAATLSPTSGLRALAPWYALATTTPAARKLDAPVLVVVAPTRALTIAVLDERGWPLAGTKATVGMHGLVEFPRVLDDTEEWTQARTTRDVETRHHWDALPLAKTVVTIHQPGRRPVTLTVDATTPAEMTVTLVPIAHGERIIAGVVTDQRGALVAGATVGLGDHRTRTDASGRYVLVVEAGAVVAAAAGLFAVAPGWYPTVLPEFGARVERLGEGSLAADLVLDRASVALRGRIVDHDGAPVAGAAIYPWCLPNLTSRETAEDLAAPADGAPLSLTGNLVRAFARSGEDGSFEVPGLDRRVYRFRVYHERQGFAWTTDELLPGGESVVIMLPPDLRCTVRGRVFSRDGRPAAGVAIRTYLEVHGNGGGMASAGLRLGGRTDDEGRFLIEEMPCHGGLLAFEGAEWVQQSVRLDGPPAGDLDVVMLRRCHVRVRLADPVWADATIEFLEADGEVVMIVEERGRTQMVTANHRLHDGKTEVLAITEAAVVLVVTAPENRDQPSRKSTFQIALRPGEINQLEL